MLWSFVTPIVVTTVLTVLLYLVLRKSKWSKRAGLLAVFAFIPTCALVKVSSDAYRFREHHFANAESITFSMVRSNIPNKAKDIELHFQPGGYWAKFDIEKLELESWFDMRWENYEDRTVYPKEDSRVVTLSPKSPSQFNQFFSRHGWSHSGSVVTYVGPIFPSGGGSHLYFNPKTGKAYQFYAFW